jgi:Na+/glutamate symporter
MLFANEDIFNAILNNEQQVQTQFQEVQKKQSKVEDEKPSKKTSKKLGLVCICLVIAYFILMYIIW